MLSLYECCYRGYIYIQQECHPVLVKLHPITFYKTVFLGSARFLGWMPLFVIFGLPVVSCSLINSLILGCSWLLAFVLSNTLMLGIWCSAISHHSVLSLDFLSEYRIQHGAIGPLYVTSSYSTWIFCRGVSGFATDCPCSVWCRGLTTCFLHVGPPFGNRLLNNNWAVGLTLWIAYIPFLFWHMHLYMSWYIVSCFGFIFTSWILFFIFTPVLLY